MQLIVAEKPSVAQSIGSVIGATKKRSGYLEGNGYIVSWCAGHLLELASPDVYNASFAKWKYSDLPIVPENWIHVPLKSKEAQLQILNQLMNRSDVDFVINACDAGREGELIFRLVYEYAKCIKPLKRLWISSMEQSAIKTGIEAIKDSAEYDNLHAAASCRERADWLVGLNCTRLFSVLYGDVLQVGRVQSPTIAMLVKRDADIASFVKEPFYTVELSCGEFVVSGEKNKDKCVAENIRTNCNGKSAVIKSITQQEKSTAPPKLFDLTSLQRQANKEYGYTAKETLDYMQSLYEKRMATYPRTDSRYLTEDMTSVIPTLVKISTMITGIEYTGAVNVNQVINNSKASDHHAIIPTVEITQSQLVPLPTGEKNILKMLAKRLIEAVGDKYIYTETIVTIDCAGSSFTTKGVTVKQTGLKSAVDWEKSLLELSEGQTINNVTATIKKGTTTPPKAYTEDTLLATMETAGAEDVDKETQKKGLGTPATRAATIEKIISSGFALRKKKSIIPTEKGKFLVGVLPEVLASPKLTAEWEHKLFLIEKGQLSATQFMDDIKQSLKQIVSENITPKPEFNTRKINSPALGICPRCGNKIYEAIRGFFCENHSCGFKLFKDSKFWTAKKKKLTSDMVTLLLKEGRIRLKGLYSEKSGKKYDATIILNDLGEGNVNFRMEFGEGIAKA